MHPLRLLVAIAVIASFTSCRDLAPEDEFAYATPEELDAAKRADTAGVDDSSAEQDAKAVQDVADEDGVESDDASEADGHDEDTEDGQGHVAGPCDGKQDGATCDDSNACTKGDVCKGGFCKGVPDDCDDGKFCTKDKCDPQKGCSHPTLPNKTKCDDDNSCTSNDECEGADCFGDMKDCEDNNPCTADGCEVKDGKCINDPQPHDKKPCDDKDKCTDKGICSAGVCKGTAKMCDDGKACTIDGCDKAKGCTTKNLEGACDTDDDACNGIGACKDGDCKMDKPVKCDDANPCTDDSCDKNKGCVNAFNTAACDDGDKCTAASACKSGKCAPGKPALWDKAIANAGDDDVKVVLPTANGGFIAVGRVATAADGYQAAARRLDAGGTALWSKQYGDKQDDSAYDASMLPGGKSFVVAGAIRLKGESHDRPQLRWINVADGKSTNSKVSGGGTSQAWFAAVVATSQRILTVGTAQAAGEELNGWVRAVDHAGKELWSTSIGGLGDQRFAGMVAEKDGTWAVGSHQIKGSATTDALISLIDGSGKVKWSRTFGGAGTDQLRGGAKVANGMMFAGRSDSFSKDTDLWLVGTNAAGVITWQRTIKGDFVETEQRVRSFAGGLLIAAHGPQGAGKPNAWLLDVDRHGQLRWQTHFSGNGVVMDAAPIGSNRLAVAIAEFGSKVNGYDWRLLRTDAFGHTNCKSAGDCATKAFAGCSDNKICTTDNCTSATGCYSTAHKGACADGAPCSTDGTCATGACKKGPDRLWTATIDDNDDDEATSVIANYAGGHYVGGQRALAAAKGGKGGQDLWVARYGMDGKQQWQVLAGSVRDDAVFDLIPAGKGAVIAVGQTENKDGAKQPIAMYVGGDGKATWTTTWAAKGESQFRAGLAVTAATFAFLGEQRIDGSGLQAWVIVVDATGKQLLSRDYGGKNSDESGMDLIRLASGAIAIVGETDAQWSKLGNQIVIRQVDAGGKEIGQWTAGGPMDEFVERAVPQANGGVIVAGSRRNKGGKQGTERGLLIALDGKGKTLWSRYDTSFRNILGVTVTAGGDLVAAGTTAENRAQLRRYEPGKGALIGGRAYPKLAGELSDVAASLRGTLVSTGLIVNGDNQSGLLMTTDLWGNTTCGKGLCLATASTPVLCTDGHACTIENCDNATGCGAVAVDSLCTDNDPCTADLCDAKKGCTHAPAKDGTPCDDGDACTAAASCKTAGGKSTCQGGKPALWSLPAKTTSATELYDAAHDEESGYIATVGHYDGGGAGGGYGKVTALDAAGQTKWTHTKQSGPYRAIEAVKDGGFAAVGYNPTFSRAHLTRLSAAGKVVFDKTFGKTGRSAFSALMLEEKAIVAAGRTIGGTSGSGGSGKNSGWIVRFNDKGTVIAEGFAEGSGDWSDVRGIAPTPGGVFAVGVDGDIGKLRSWVWAANNAGSKLWERTLDANGDQSELDAVIVRKPHYIAVGSKVVNGKREGRIVSLDDKGGLMWDRSLGSTHLLQPRAIAATGATLLVAGYGIEKIGVASQGAFARIDAVGNVQVSHYGGVAGDRFWGLVPHGTRVTLVGASFPTAASSPIGWIVNADLFGNTTCAESGGCADKPISGCDDDQGCTLDGCEKGKCAHKPLKNGALCTGSDLCQAGTCSNGKCGQVKPRNCSDGNDCSSDSCDPAAGCINVSLASECNGTLWKGHCFEASYGKARDWKTAEAACANNGGHLASIASQSENDAAHRERMQICGAWSFAWIGLNDVAKEGDYVWSDGSKLTFKAWADKEPNNAGDEDHVMFTRGDAAWMDYNKADVFCHVCERDVPVCDDASKCSAHGLCGPGGCVMSKGPACDDGNGCTADFCNASDGTCKTIGLKVGEACDDGDPCTTKGKCDKHLTCRAAESFACSDGKSCTADNCIPGKGCTNVVPDNGCDGAKQGVNCVKVFDDAGSYSDAVGACAQWGGELASVHVAADNEAIRKLAQSAGCGDALIGLNDRGVEGVWRWRDLSLVDFENWAKNEPNNDLKGFGDEHIVMMSTTDGKWHDRWLQMPAACVVCSRPIARTCAADAGCLAGTCDSGTCKPGSSTRLWGQTIKGSARDHIFAGAATPDGGVIVAGASSSKDLGAKAAWDAFAAYVGPDGKLGWHLTRNGSATSGSYEHFRAVHVLSSGVIVLGGTLGTSSPGDRGYIETVARDGSTITQTYLGPSTGIYGAARNGDGAMLFGGGFDTQPVPLLQPVDKNGALKTQVVFKNQSSRIFTAGVRMGSKWMMAGEDPINSRAYWFVLQGSSITASGKDDDAGRESAAHAIVPAASGVFIAGSRWPTAAGASFGVGHVWRVTNDGKKMWSVNVSSFFEIHDMVKRHDGAYLLAGRTKTQGRGGTLDESGNEKSGGFNADLQLSKLVALPDLNYAVIGMTGSSGAEDGKVIRMTAWGVKDCKAAGKCKSPGPTSCDDGKACTFDNCTAADGCTHKDYADGLACADGKKCNKTAVCQ